MKTPGYIKASERIAAREPFYLVDAESGFLVRYDPDKGYFAKPPDGGDEYPTTWENDIVFRAVHGGREVTRERYHQKR